MQQEGMEYINCNLCGADNAEKLYDMPDAHYYPDERFTVVRCRNCGLGYLNPRPKQDALDKYYPPAYFNIFEVDASLYRKRYAREGYYIQKYSSLPEGRKPILLDIGCANGGFLRHMRALGWDVEGLEIGAAAKTMSDFKVHNVLFTDLPVQTPSYDVVTAWAVLEHVHDPMAYFKKAQEILFPGGLFIFLVPNFDSLASYGLFREDVPRHIYFYNEKTAKSYLKRTGFELVKAVHKNDIWDMAPVGWLLYKLNKLMGRPALTYEDIPMSFSEWIGAKKLPRTARSAFKFFVAHPLVTVDRITMPLYARFQMMTGTYGTSMYVARKI